MLLALLLDSVGTRRTGVCVLSRVGAAVAAAAASAANCATGSVTESLLFFDSGTAEACCARLAPLYEKLSCCWTPPATADEEAVEAAAAPAAPTRDGRREGSREALAETWR